MQSTAMPSSASTRPSGRQIALGVAICEGAGIVSSLFTLSALRDWYPRLIKPVWTPPNEVFGPVWVVLYALMGVSLAYYWASNQNLSIKKTALTWFWIQLALNVAWTLGFFGLRAPALGYAIIMVLWCAIAALFWTGSRVSKVATLLLVPYFLWVTFASSLNFAILGFNVLRDESARMDADPRNQNSPEDPPIIVKKR